MKRLFYIAAIVLLFLSSCGGNMNSTTTEMPKVPQHGGIQWGSFLLRDGEEVYHLPYLTAEGTADTISGPLRNCSFIDLGPILEEDINFDGIPDVQICLGPQNHWGNNIYEGFIWDKQEGHFVWVENYHEIFSPEIHYDSMYILGTDYFFFEGVSSTDYTKYEWVDGKLTATDNWSESEGEMWD